MQNYSNKRAGVYFEEVDKSAYSTGTVTVGSAVITPTVKGKTYLPRTVTNMFEYEDYFGTTFKSGSDYYEYLGSLLAKNYFDNGGDSLLVVPIKSGSYSPATSNVVNFTGSTSFTLETLSDGAIMNNSGSEIVGSSGSLSLGTSDNIRWEVSNVNSGSGTFTVLVRQGDDNTKRKTILEQFNDVSLDPKSTTYISRVIGDYTYNYDSVNKVLQQSGSFQNNSKFIRVATVDLKTPDYFDTSGVAKSIFTGSLPIISSGSFGGGSNGSVAQPQLFFENISATNSQGFGSTTDSYDVAIGLLSNPDEYKFNLLFLPGITASTHGTIVSKALAMVESRGDSLLIVDPVEYNKQPADAISVAQGFDSSYMALYYPHVQIKSVNLNKNVWCPPSTVVAGVFAYSDKVSSPAFAPAGYNRGSLNSLTGIQAKFGADNKDSLFTNNVNLIAPYDKNVYVILSQNTTQLRPTALDRIAVRRLEFKIKNFVQEIAPKYLFEPNSSTTRLQFVSELNREFGRMIEKREAYDIVARVIEDNASFDRSELPVVIEISPLKAIEKIIVQLVLNETGVKFV
jgi:Phage tail sheath protein subtilisin-like domain